MTHIIKYSIDMNHDNKVSVEETKKWVETNKVFVDEIIKMNDTSKLLKKSVEYSSIFVNLSKQEKVDCFDDIFSLIKNSGVEIYIPAVAKGLLFFEETPEEFIRTVVESFMSEDDKVVISDLMKELTNIDEGEELDKDILARRGEIKEVLESYQSSINGKLSISLDGNFITKENYQSKLN